MLPAGEKRLAAEIFRRKTIPLVFFCKRLLGLLFHFSTWQAELAYGGAGVSCASGCVAVPQTAIPTDMLVTHVLTDLLTACLSGSCDCFRASAQPPLSHSLQDFCASRCLTCCHSSVAGGTTSPQLMQSTIVEMTHVRDECADNVRRAIETLQAEENAEENAYISVRQSRIVSHLEDQYTRKAVRTALWRLKSQKVIDVATPSNKMKDGGAWWWLQTNAVPRLEEEEKAPEKAPDVVLDSAQISPSSVAFLEQFSAMFPDHPFLKEKRFVKSIPASGRCGRCERLVVS